MAGRLGFNQITCGRAADLFVAGEQDGDWQRRGDAGARELTDRLERQVIAALHVKDSGAPGAVALPPEGQAAQGPDRVNSVKVAHHQNAGHGRRGMWKSGVDAGPEAHATGYSLGARASNDQVARRDVHHPVDRGWVIGRAFALNPEAQALQHCVRVEG